jgi:hypothetical protein
MIMLLLPKTTENFCWMRRESERKLPRVPLIMQLLFPACMPLPFKEIIVKVTSIYDVWVIQNSFWKFHQCQWVFWWEKPNFWIPPYVRCCMGNKQLCGSLFIQQEFPVGLEARRPYTTSAGWPLPSGAAFICISLLSLVWSSNSPLDKKLLI